ncbi:MAG: GNAT family N-acetyltransferase [Saprospiraceae bacterium]|nr:GNAT family N-acetyltransferase [Saprospiraceae bacterium]
MTDPKFAIRLAKAEDLAAIQQLFVDTIRSVCSSDYNEQEIAVWVSSIQNIARWNDKLTSTYFIVAEHEATIVGFASLADKEYFDLLYVHKDYQRMGVAHKLYTQIELEAIKRKAEILNVEVSKTAIGFFEKMGYQVVAKQSNVKKDVAIVNYKMSKKLDSQENVHQEENSKIFERNELNF